LCPHEPQLSGSVIRLKQGLVGEHAAVAQQVLLVHVPAQVLPQPPQCAGSVLVSTQAPLQYV